MGNRNKKERQEGSKRKRQRSTNIRHLTRQDRYFKRGLRQQEAAGGNNDGGAPPAGGGGASFEEAFADVGEMTATMEARMEEIQQDVARANEEDRMEEEGRQIREQANPASS